jgi:hypothetical protein
MHQWLRGTQICTKMTQRPSNVIVCAKWSELCLATHQCWKYVPAMFCIGKPQNLMIIGQQCIPAAAFSLAIDSLSPGPGRHTMGSYVCVRLRLLLILAFKCFAHREIACSLSRILTPAAYFHHQYNYSTSLAKLDVELRVLFFLILWYVFARRLHHLTIGQKSQCAHSGGSVIGIQSLRAPTQIHKFLLPIVPNQTNERHHSRRGKIRPVTRREPIHISHTVCPINVPFLQARHRR